MFYDKVPSFLVTGAKFHFLEIISNATVIFFKEKICSDYSKRDTHINKVFM